MARTAAEVRVVLTGADKGYTRTLRKGAKKARQMDERTREVASGLRRTDRAARRSARGVKRWGRSANRSGRSAKSFGRSLKFAGGALLAAFSVRQMGRLARGLFRVGVNAEETGDKFRVSLGKSAGEATRFLEENATAMGLSISEGKELLATNTAIAKGMGATGEAASQLAQRIVTVGGDIAAFNNIPTETVIKGITSAMAGNTEAARAFGVQITAADRDARALEQTGKTTKSSLTQLEKSMAALTLITERAGPAMGNVEETLESTQGQFRQLVAEAKNVRDAFSTAVLPVFKELLTAIVDNKDAIKEFASTMSGAVADAVRTFVEAASTDFALAAEQVGVIMGVRLGQGILKGMEFLSQENIFARALPDFLNLGGLAVDALSEQAAESERIARETLRTLQQGSDSFKQRVAETFEGRDVLGFGELTGLGSVPVPLQDTRDVQIPLRPNLIGPSGKPLDEEIKDSLNKTVESAIPARPDAGFRDRLLQPVDIRAPVQPGTPEVIGGALQQEFELIPPPDIDPKDILGDPLEDMEEFAVSGAKAVGEAVISGIITGADNLGDILKRFFVSLASKAIMGGLFSVLDIGSPSRATAEIGKNIGEGLVVGMRRIEPQVRAASEALAARAAPPTSPSIGPPGSNGSIQIEPREPTINVHVPPPWGNPNEQALTSGAQVFIREGLRSARRQGFRD